MEFGIAIYAFKNKLRSLEAKKLGETDLNRELRLKKLYALGKLTQNERAILREAISQEIKNLNVYPKPLNFIYKHECYFTRYAIACRAEMGFIAKQNGESLPVNSVSAVLTRLIVKGYIIRLKTEKKGFYTVNKEMIFARNWV
jgi:hypothetical protein